MANAPDVQTPEEPDEGGPALRDRTLARLDDAGLRAEDDRLVWERTPRGLAAEHPGSAGALYGAASNDAFAAFRRPANRTPVRGLYLASGSAHPGGGIPLCALSGLAAVDCVREDAP
jgi:phytoene dehydrogenase-like protein